MADLGEIFLTELKQRAEQDTELESGKLLVEKLPASGSFNFFDPEKSSRDELDELKKKRDEKAEVITNKDSLICGTLEYPCVYVLIGLEFFMYE